MTSIRVLFVCTHNSARSQLAEALLDRLGGDGFEAHSAGTAATRVNPYAIRVLAEQGIDWTGATSKAIDGFLGQRFDHVITVCDQARETCPVFPGSTSTLHWGLDDPSDVAGLRTRSAWRPSGVPPRRSRHASCRSSRTPCAPPAGADRR